MRKLRQGAVNIFLGLVAIVVGIWLVAPVLIMIPLAFTSERNFKFPPEAYSTRWFEVLLEDSSWRDSLVTSLVVAIIVVAVAVIVGTACAIGLNRSSLPGKPLLRALVLTPQIVPIVVAGVGVYIVALQTKLVGTTAGFVLAHVGLAIPFVVVSVTVSLAGFDRRLELAAASLGASPGSTFMRVTLPIILPGVLGGAAFAFVTSLDEVVMALFLSDPMKRTIPVKMFQTIEDIDPTIAAASVVILTATTIMIVIAFVATQSSRKRTQRRA